MEEPGWTGWFPGNSWEKIPEMIPGETKNSNRMIFLENSEKQIVSKQVKHQAKTLSHKKVYQIFKDCINAIFKLHSLVKEGHFPNSFFF